MKKTLLSAFGMVVALSMCAMTAFAAGPRCGRNFVDADGDGICDNAGSMCIYADADGNGTCDVCGADYTGCLTGDGTVFADADGDGICDNCGSYHRCGMAGIGGGSNFVDADGDGVCDNYAAGQGSRSQGGGYGRGCQGGRGNGFWCGRGR